MLEIIGIISIVIYVISAGICGYFSWKHYTKISTRFVTRPSWMEFIVCLVAPFVPILNTYIAIHELFDS